MLGRGVPEHAGRPATRRTLAGLRRVAWVRVTMLADGPTCHAIGSGHHNPVVRRIPLSRATELIASGVPSLVVRQPAGAASAHQVPARAGAQD